MGSGMAGITKLAKSPRMGFRRDQNDKEKTREEGKVPDNLYQRHKIMVSRYVKDITDSAVIIIWDFHS